MKTGHRGHHEPEDAFLLLPLALLQKKRRRRAGALREPRRLRWLEGTTPGHRPSLRERPPGAALPEPQDAQSDRPSAQGTPRSGQNGAQDRLGAGCHDGEAENRADRQVGREAASGELEGGDARFTDNAIGLAPALKRCLGTTNVIDNAHSDVCRHTSRVTHWTNGSMAVR